VLLVWCGGVVWCGVVWCVTQIYKLTPLQMLLCDVIKRACPGQVVMAKTASATPSAAHSADGELDLQGKSSNEVDMQGGGGGGGAKPTASAATAAAASTPKQQDQKSAPKATATPAATASAASAAPGAAASAAYAAVAAGASSLAPHADSVVSPAPAAKPSDGEPDMM
jgi:hypothetical protein